MNRLGTHLEHDWNKLGIGLERTGLEHVIVTIGTGLEHVGTGLERVHDPVHFFVVLVFNFASEASVVHISFIFRLKIRSCLVAAGRRVPEDNSVWGRTVLIMAHSQRKRILKPLSSSENTVKL